MRSCALTGLCGRRFGGAGVCLVALLAGSLGAVLAGCTPETRTPTAVTSTASPTATAGSQPVVAEKPSPAAPSRQESDTLKHGKALEAEGKFREASDLYTDALTWTAAAGGTETGRDLIQRRLSAMAFLDLAIQTEIYWHPHSPDELDAARAALRADYDAYRKPALALLSIVQAATKENQAKPDKAAYREKVLQAMDAYVDLVATTSKYDQASITFQQLLESLRNLTNAYKDWDTPDRARLLKSAFMYADACRERMVMTEFGDNIWER